MKIAFDTQKLILRNTQTGGDYNGVSSSFSAKLFATKMPVLIDIGFNDIVQKYLLKVPQTEGLQIAESNPAFLRQWLQFQPNYLLHIEK